MILHDNEPRDVHREADRSSTDGGAACWRSYSPARHDKFVAHLYQARKQYRLVCERPNKGNKAIEREVISSYQVAQSLGFNGDFRAWEHLLRIQE